MARSPRPALSNTVAPSPAIRACADRASFPCRQGQRDRAPALSPLPPPQTAQEVSGYIDYGHRLKTESMEPYFDRKKRLMPRPSDLSFYNWETQMSTSNPTPNFQVRCAVRCASGADPLNIRP
jgi:hypothetical protein